MAASLFFTSMPNSAPSFRGATKEPIPTHDRMPTSTFRVPR